MAKPFRIRVNSISAQPLSAEQTAEKYGLPAHELRRVRSFVIKRDSTSGNVTNGKSVKESRVLSVRKSRRPR